MLNGNKGAGIATKFWTIKLRTDIGAEVVPRCQRAVPAADSVSSTINKRAGAQHKSRVAEAEAESPES